MEVRGVGGVNPMDSSEGKIRKLSQNAKVQGTADSFSVSEEAVALKDEAFLKSVVAKVTAIDGQRVAQARERLANGYYDKKEVLDALTDRMMKALGL